MPGPRRVLRPQLPSRGVIVFVVGFRAVGVAKAVGSNQRSIVRALPDKLPSRRQSAKALIPTLRGPARVLSLLPARAVKGRPVRMLPSPLMRQPPRISETARSEEHTSELQSLAYLVCRLLLEKKKKIERNE